MLVIIYLVVVALGNSLHQKGDIIAEQGTDFIDTVRGIFHDIVQQSRTDDAGIRLHHFPNDDERHTDGMNDIGFPVFAFLRTMRLLRQNKSLFNFLPFFGSQALRQRTHQIFMRSGY